MQLSYSYVITLHYTTAYTLKTKYRMMMYCIDFCCCIACMVCLYYIVLFKLFYYIVLYYIIYVVYIALR